MSQRGPIHPDLEILRPIGPTRSITIDQVRGISLAASTRPVSAERKVFILDDADRLKVEAGNSILKVLEEPPEFMTIILVTSEPSRILPTIRSRCAVYNFRPLGEDELRNELIGKYGAEPGQAAFLARYTRGSIGQALTLLADAGFMERRYALMDKLMAAHAFTALEILGFCQEYGERKEGSTELLGLYRAFLRDIALIKAMGEAARARVSNPDMYDDMRKASYDWPEGKAGKALRALGELEKAWAYTRGNLNFRLGLEACLFKGLAGVEVTGVFGPVANHGFMV